MLSQLLIFGLFVFTSGYFLPMLRQDSNLRKDWMIFMETRHVRERFLEEFTFLPRLPR